MQHARGLAGSNRTSRASRRPRVLQETRKVVPFILGVEQSHAVLGREFFAPRSGVFKRGKSFRTNTAAVHAQLAQRAPRGYQPAVRAADQHVSIAYRGLSAGKKVLDRFGEVSRRSQQCHSRRTI
jgi:hypothetical protein